MCDLLRHLQREGESGRGSLGPTANGLARRDGIEGGIDFHRVECPRVNREEIHWPCTDRIEWSDPGVVIPSLRADANSGELPATLGTSLFLVPLGHEDTIGSG